MIWKKTRELRSSLWSKAPYTTSQNFEFKQPIAVRGNTSNVASMMKFVLDCAEKQDGNGRKASYQYLLLFP